MLVDVGEFAQPDCKFGQPTHQRGLALIEKVFPIAAALMKFFGVRQNILACAQLIFFSRSEPSRTDLLGLGFEQRPLATSPLQSFFRLRELAPNGNNAVKSSFIVAAAASKA